MTARPLTILALQDSHDYAQGVATHLALSPFPLEERRFEDGEVKIRPLVDVAGHDVHVVQSLHGDGAASVHDRLCRLAFLIACLKDNDAASVTLTAPYLCYARKDRRTQPFDPVTMRYVATMLEAMGVDRVMALEVHNPAAAENAFRRPFIHLETAGLFADHFRGLARDLPVTVVSPDTGGAKRAERFRQALQAAAGRAVDSGFVEKNRSGGFITGGALMGDVKDRAVIILDDMISTGATMVRAARACRLGGARLVHIAATHGLFNGGAATLFSDEVDSVVVTNSVTPVERPPLSDRKLTILDTSPLIAAAIRRLRAGT
ncbi:ribose-phosphate diphosphokinase [Nitrospirillum viridazoti]|uniref:ribose-phosphate diphosphokinase n=1 Tax=Nitrospirillum viridazoti CBAmc TaxID=1441467 RepID=A0A248K227_9PROT|nr:ribose-phosphate diphosphokinase [Nitrospirillum amazonense]ASG24484.1 ribose-phosphate pyrophosphokinase [Nitrospirillum amazonense CBAmc]TWB37172.1 ribose-phosphate pyrophosphokinase [Nitrospirillum amazonense]